MFQDTLVIEGYMNANAVTMTRPERITKKVFMANSNRIPCFFPNSSPNTE